MNLLGQKKIIKSNAHIFDIHKIKHKGNIHITGAQCEFIIVVKT